MPSRPEDPLAKPMKRLVGGAAEGSADCGTNFFDSLDSTELWLREHLDAVISFAGAEQRRRLFRVLDILTVEWTTGDLPEGCRS